MNVYKIHMLPGFHVFYLYVLTRILMLHHQDNIMELETVANISKTLSFICHLLAIHNCSFTSLTLESFFILYYTITQIQTSTTAI